MKEVSFQISSRATILLGRESVAQANGALIELVKNTYDADAELCIIYFDTENKRILILDNGSGMTEDAVLNNWMLIGTDNKKHDFISEKDRIKSGEKGIGRFALDRLGTRCEMYTKSKVSDELIHWQTNWSDFEKSGVNVNDIKASYEIINEDFYEILPQELKETVVEIKKEIIADLSTDFTVGTLFIIEDYRDEWNKRSITKITEDMAFLIPPKEQEDFGIVINSDQVATFEIIETNIADDYDHKLNIKFDGELFNVTTYRNEYRVNDMPNELFSNELYFNSVGHTRELLDNNKFEETYTISQLFKLGDTEEERIKIEKIREIGAFQFDFIFLKKSATRENSKIFYYKTLGKNRREWLENYSGIKIYRDNFFVRPYGEKDSVSFDWLGLDKRATSDPTSVASPTGSWKVYNNQIQGSLSISRISNLEIADTASREGLINTDSFKLLKEALIRLINIFEKDRSQIAYTLKRYYDTVNKDEQAKKKASKYAQQKLSEKSDKKSDEQEEDADKNLASAYKILESEQEELVSENQLLKSLATNGLITTAIIHDLKNIKGTFITRVEDIKMSIDAEDEELLSDNLEALKKNDEYLDNWMEIALEQAKTDKRNRLKEDLANVVTKISQSIEPILTQKNIKIEITYNPEIKYNKRIFYRDFQSILYNLIINSVEAFEKERSQTKLDTIKIKIEKTDTHYIIEYEDNGPGIDKTVFKSPAEILQYGETSKRDSDNKSIGLGLGMFIVHTTIRDYNGSILFKKDIQGFGIVINIPI